MNYDLMESAGYLDEGTTGLSIPRFLMLWWVAVMEWYLTQYERGIRALAVRYADLNTHRERVVSEIFTYCGLPIEHVPETLSVFARDAQAGTQLARDNPAEGNKLRLSDEQRREMLRILQRHPVVKNSDFIVPGTLHV